MTDAAIVRLTDEVVDAFNKKSGAFAQSYACKRVYRPKFDLEQIDTLQVQSFPFQTRLIGPISRSAWEHQYDIDTVVFFKADPKDGEQPQAKFDPLQRLLEEMADHFKTTRTASECSFVSAAIGAASELPYLHEAITTSNAFLSGVRITFRKYR